MGKFNQSVTRHILRYTTFQMRGSAQLSSLASKIYGTILWKSTLAKAFGPFFYYYEKTLTKTNSETKRFILLMLQVTQQGTPRQER